MFKIKFEHFNFKSLKVLWLKRQENLTVLRYKLQYWDLKVQFRTKCKNAVIKSIFHPYKLSTCGTYRKKVTCFATIGWLHYTNWELKSTEEWRSFTVISRRNESHLYKGSRSHWNVKVQGHHFSSVGRRPHAT